MPSSSGQGYKNLSPGTANPCFKPLQFGLKRLVKVDQERLKRRARPYNKSYPGELVHLDTKRLPLLKGQSPAQPREYLFVAMDDFSRELYAGILPDKAQDSVAQFLVGNVIAQCPYQIDYAYSDNGKEYRGTDNHALASHSWSRRFCASLSWSPSRCKGKACEPIQTPPATTRRQHGKGS